MFPTNMDRYLSIFNYWETVIKQEIWGTPLSEKKNIQAPVTWNCSFLPASYTHTKRKSRDSSGIVKVVGFSKNDQKSGFIEIVGCDDVILFLCPLVISDGWPDNQRDCPLPGKIREGKHIFPRSIQEKNRKTE